MSNSKTIAKNTLFLYFRMFLTMGVGLFTSRLVLEALGVVDYGIYGLVGGIVTTFAFLNSAMASATQRYLSFDIGKNDLDRLQKTFNATLNIHFLIALVIFVLAETIGLWFINNKLDIPIDRLYAANWVFQFSIFAFILNVIQVPYNALLIAREHMNIYAYVSILETILKLIIVLILVQADTNRLILYAILTFCVSFVIRLVYIIYCKRKFKESVYKFYFDKTYYKELLSYSGWNLFGNIAVVAKNQGSNILLNLFFGVVLNAAYSLTIMVQGIIGQFVNNFQTAINPQIVKNYSKGDNESSINLMFKSAKFSFFAMFILVVPLLFNVDYVMHLWLREVPPYTVGFIKLALINSLIDTISNPLITGAQATGKIKWYQVTIGSLIFLTLPINWMVFSIFNNPLYFYWVLIGNSIVALGFRLFFLVRMIGLNISLFLKDVLIKIISVVFVSLLLTYLGLNLFKFSNQLYEVILSSIIITLSNLIVIIFIGLSASEKHFIISIVNSKLKN